MARRSTLCGGYRLLLLIAVGGVVYLWMFLSFISSSSHTSIVALKLPRSGSSWFTEQLNRDKSIFVMKEIIQGADVELSSTIEKQNIIHRALLKPTDKLAQRHYWYPTTRFLEDYIFHPTIKILSKLEVIGCTLNPEHAIIDWSAAVRGVPGVRIVLFVRGNLIKVALSDIRGKLLKEACGSANIKSSRPDCQLPAQLALPVAEGRLLQSLVSWQKRYDDFFSLVHNDPTLSRLPTHIVYYEELQQNPAATMQRLWAFLRPPGSTKTEFELGSSGFSGTWVKRTSEDLSSVISNFAEWDELFSPPECGLYRAMLRDPGGTVFRHEERHRDEARRRQTDLCIQRLLS